MKNPSMLPLLSSPLVYIFSSIQDTVAPGLECSGAFLWCGDLTSRTTFCPCGLLTPVNRFPMRLERQETLETLPRPACALTSLNAA